MASISASSFCVRSAAPPSRQFSVNFHFLLFSSWLCVYGSVERFHVGSVLVFSVQSTASLLIFLISILLISISCRFLSFNVVNYEVRGICLFELYCMAMKRMDDELGVFSFISECFISIYFVVLLPFELFQDWFVIFTALGYLGDSSQGVRCSPQCGSQCCIVKCMKDKLTLILSCILCPGRI